MIAKKLSFALPVPWTNTRFEAEEIGPINFLVGPNGSGKSKFAEVLMGTLKGARLLGTDRLAGMEHHNGLRAMQGDLFAGGQAKNQFPNLKSAGQQGSGIDTFIILEERLDLRILVEATLTWAGSFIRYRGNDALPWQWLPLGACMSFIERRASTLFLAGHWMAGTPMRSCRTSSCPLSAY